MRVRGDLDGDRGDARMGMNPYDSQRGLFDRLLASPGGMLLRSWLPADSVNTARNERVRTADELNARVAALDAEGRDVYYMPAEVEPGKTGKRHDISRIHILRVDIDDLELPEGWLEGEPPKEPRLRRVRMMLAQLAEAGMRPYRLIATGGGLHIVWLLEPQDCDLETAARHDQANRNLIALFGGDVKCFDVGRIWRMPGSRNMKPNRGQRRVKLIPMGIYEETCGPECVLPLWEATAAIRKVMDAEAVEEPAPRPSRRRSAARSADRAPVLGNSPAWEAWGLSEGDMAEERERGRQAGRVHVFEEGELTDLCGKWDKGEVYARMTFPDGRSGAFLAVCKSLVAQGYEDGAIEKAMRDPRNLVGARLREPEKCADPEREMARTLWKARAFVAGALGIDGLAAYPSAVLAEAKFAAARGAPAEAAAAQGGAGERLEPMDREAAEAMACEELNRMFMWVDYGVASGRHVCRVFEGRAAVAKREERGEDLPPEAVDDDGDLIIEEMTKGSFRDALISHRLPVRGRGDRVEMVPKADLWLGSPGRRHYSRVSFRPSHAITPMDAMDYPTSGGALDGKQRIFNTWGGFRLEPQEPTKDNERWRSFVDHLEHVACPGCREPGMDMSVECQFLLRWMAHFVRRPGKLPKSAILLHGRQGCGKSMIAVVLRSMLHYRNWSTSSDPDVGSFNDDENECVLYIQEEGVYGGSHRANSRLKDKITNERLTINEKFKNRRKVANVMRTIITSNEDWVLAGEEDDRRFAVFPMSDAYTKVGALRDDRKAYFDRLHMDLYGPDEARDYGGVRQFMWYLLNKVELEVPDEERPGAMRPWSPQEIPDTPFFNRGALSQFTQRIKSFLEYMHVFHSRYPALLMELGKVTFEDGKRQYDADLANPATGEYVAGCELDPRWLHMDYKRFCAASKFNQPLKLGEFIERMGRMAPAVKLNFGRYGKSEGVWTRAQGVTIEVSEEAFRERVHDLEGHERPGGAVTIPSPDQVMADAPVTEAAPPPEPPPIDGDEEVPF